MMGVGILGPHPQGGSQISATLGLSPTAGRCRQWRFWPSVRGQSFASGRPLESDTEPSAGAQKQEWACCRKGDPFQGPKPGSCLTLENELSEETQADKTRDFIGKGHPGGEQEGKGTQELLCHMAGSLGFYGDGISFWVVFSQSF